MLSSSIPDFWWKGLWLSSASTLDHKLIHNCVICLTQLKPLLFGTCVVQYICFVVPEYLCRLEPVWFGTSEVLYLCGPVPVGSSLSVTLYLHIPVPLLYDISIMQYLSGLPTIQGSDASWKVLDFFL